VSDESKVEEIAILLYKQIFYDAYSRPKRIPLYVAQLQVLLEDKAFYWYVSDALRRLAEQGVLAKLEQITKYASSLLFYYPAEIAVDGSSVARVKQHVYSLAQLVNRYSSPTVTHAVGMQLEGLVKYELKAQGFKIVGTNSRSYKTREWTKTGDNLDFVAEHTSSSFAIGVEVKNTLGVLDRREVEVKIDICKYLGILPVFAVRWIGPHHKLVVDNGGYPWVFKTQIYPPGFEKLVKQIFKRLSLNWNEAKKNFDYQMPVIVRTELPEKPVAKFAAWVKSQLH